jgi:hypothetical protein
MVFFLWWVVVGDGGGWRMGEGWDMNMFDNIVIRRKLRYYVRIFVVKVGLW